MKWDVNILEHIFFILIIKIDKTLKRFHNFAVNLLLVSVYSQKVNRSKVPSLRNMQIKLDRLTLCVCS